MLGFAYLQRDLSFPYKSWIWKVNFTACVSNEDRNSLSKEVMFVIHLTAIIRQYLFNSLNSVYLPVFYHVCMFCVVSVIQDLHEDLQSL